MEELCLLLIFTTAVKMLSTFKVNCSPLIFNKNVTILTGKMRMNICFCRMTACYHWTPTLPCSANSFSLSFEELVIKAEF